jgi:hypothetical protein
LDPSVSSFRIALAFLPTPGFFFVISGFCPTLFLLATAAF